MFARAHENMVSEGILLGIFAAAGWGVSDFFAKIAATRERDYLPVHISGLVSFLLLTLYNFLFPIPRYGAFTLIPSIAIVSFPMALGWWFFMLSLRKAKVSIQGPLSASYGLVTLVGGLLFLSEAPSGTQVFGALFIIAGAVTVSLKTANLWKLRFDLNALYAALASFCWGVAFIFLPQFAKAYPAQVAFQSHILFSFIFSLMFVAYFRLKLVPRNFSDFLPPMAIGVFDSVSNLAYYSAAAFFYSSLLSPITSIYPVFTIALAHVFLKERLERTQLLSVAIILIGIVLISA